MCLVRIEADYPKSIALIKTIVYWLLFLSALFVVGTLLIPMFPAEWERCIYGTFGTIAIVAITLLALKAENKTRFDCGLVWESATIVRFVNGLVIGATIFVTIIGLLLVFTSLQLQRSDNPWNSNSIVSYLCIVPLALMEEIAFRSFSFLRLKKVFGLRITQLVVAISFALYHIATGWNVYSALLGPGIWAFVFGLAAVWSKGIALPTGIHVALNLSQQLVSMRGETNVSLWVLDFVEPVSSQSRAQAEVFGIVTQILVLIVAIIFTEWYIRKNSIDGGSTSNMASEATHSDKSGPLSA